MKKQEVIVNISGPLASGKSRLTYLFKEFLREKGFEVEYDGDVIDHPTEKNFDNVMGNDLEDALEVIKNKSLIVFQEKQMPRNALVDSYLDN